MSLHDILSAPFTKTEFCIWVLVFWGSISGLRWFCNREINEK